MSNRSFAITTCLWVFCIVFFSHCSGDSEQVENEPDVWSAQKKTYTIQDEGATYRIDQLLLPNYLDRHIASSHNMSAWGETFHLFRNGLIAFDGASFRNITLDMQHISEQTVDLLPLKRNLIGLVEGKVGMEGSDRELHLLDLESGQYMPHQEFFQHTPLADKKISRYFSTSDGILYLGTDFHGIYTLDHYETSKIPRTKDFYLLGVSDTLLVAGQRTEKGFKRLFIMNRKGETVSSLTLPSPDLQNFAFTQECLYLIRKKDKTIYCFPFQNGVFEKLWKKGVQVPSEFSFKFKSQRGLVFYRPKDKAFAVVHKDGFSRSNYFSILENSISPDELEMTILDMVGSPLQAWYATAKSLVSVRQLPADKKKNEFTYKQIQGFSSRNLSFISDSQLIVSSYAGLKEINLSDFPDSLVGKKVDSKFIDCIKGNPTYYYRDSTVEVSVNGKGILYAPIQTGSCSYLESPVAYPTELYGFQPLGFHHYLVGGKRGLYISKLFDKPITASVVMKEGRDTLNTLSINRIERVGNSDTLIICAQEGLYICRWDSSAFYLDVIHKYTAAKVNDAVILPDKSIMIATRHRGVLWLDPAPSLALRYAFNLSNHFASLVGNCLLTDDTGRVWVSTNSGLYLIDLSSHRVFDFKNITAISEQEFNHSSSAKNSAELLAFGGVNGVTFIDPKSMPTHDYHEWDSVEIQGFHSFGTGQTYWTSYNQNENFKIDYGIETIKPVAQSSLFDSDLRVFYKPTGKPYVFWQEARNGTIPIKKLEGNTEMSVLWESSNGSKEYATFKYKVSSRYFSFYGAIGISFMFIVAFYYFRSSRRYQNNEKTNNIDLESMKEEKVSSSSNKGAGSGTEKKELLPAAFPKDQLKEYLAHLKEREKQVYDIPKTISSQLLKEVTDIVFRDMNSTNFSVDQVAKEVNLSSRQLHRKLFELTGLTPNKYFTLIKMRSAKKMIIDNIDLRIGEVATAVGYSNASYFSKAFAKLYKVKPSEMVGDLKRILQEGREKK